VKQNVKTNMHINQIHVVNTRTYIDSCIMFM